MASSPDHSISLHLKNDRDLKEQEDLLQCPICIDRLEDPKDLLCNHTFCKSCLDDLLEFNSDGSAIIQCPMKCQPANYIDKGMTTNDLKTSYHLKSMLDWFETKDSQDTSTTNELTCQCGENCENQISIYCSTCSVMMCQMCQVQHTLTQGGNAPGRSYVPVKYSKKDGTTVTMCKKHNTVAKFVCCDKEFICIYCTQRRHKDHLCETIDVISTQIQTEIHTMEKNVKCRTEQVQRGVENALQSTESAIKTGRAKLTKLLEKQMLSCMAEYYALLKREEERIINEYDELTTNHLDLYKWNHSRDSFLNLRDKLPFQFIHEEEKLFEHMLERSLGVEVPLLTIGKREPVFDAASPLGNITLNVTDNVVFNHESIDVSSITVKIADENSDVPLTFLDELAQLVVEDNEKVASVDRQQYHPFERGGSPRDISLMSSEPTTPIIRLHDSDPIYDLLSDGNNIRHMNSTTSTTSSLDAKSYTSPDSPSFTRASCQLISVELFKNSYQDFGIYLSGEDNTKSGVVICDIEKGSPAYKKLKIGDKIITINGMMLNGGGLEQNILQQINTAGNRIMLGIKRSCTNFVSYN